MQHRNCYFTTSCHAAISASMIVLVWATLGNAQAAKESVDQPASPAPVSAEDPTQVRVRELIYILRQHRVSARMVEWGRAIQELTTIGKPAVPELLLELQTSERVNTLRGVLFTLRAIDDPRTIPYFIDELPKVEAVSKKGSDCALAFADDDLHQFMKRNQNYPRPSDANVLYGRPLNEMLGALHKLTKTNPPDLSKGLEPSWRSAYWPRWWNQQQLAGTAPERDKSLQLSPRDVDLVERDGVRKFGPLFPTGPNQFLSSVAEVSIQSSAFADTPSSLDLETGRMYEYLESVDFESENKQRPFQVQTWWARKGIDLDFSSAHDMHMWIVDNARWDTIDDEIKSDKEFDIGEEAESMWLPIKNRNDTARTLLFITREGSRGILRTDRRQTGLGRTYQYRIWNRDKLPVAARVPRPADTSKPWQSTGVVILKEPAFGNRCLFSFSKQEKRELPASIFAPNEPPNLDQLVAQRGMLFNDERVARWFRSEGIDVASHRVNSNVVAEDGTSTTSELLTLLDARIALVGSEAFENISVARAKEILARNRRNYTMNWLSPQYYSSNGATTYIFETKAGQLGLIQILNVSTNGSTISFEYKLAGDTEKPTEKRDDAKP